MENNNLKQGKHKRTLGEKASDWVSTFIGSWRFILLLSLFILVWITVNVSVVVLKWDNYPFILLNLLLSLLAAIQLPIILMSQNRMEEKDRRRSQVDFETNRKAEREIEEIRADLKEIKQTMRLKSKG